MSSYKGAFGGLAENLELQAPYLPSPVGAGVTKIDAAPLDPENNMNVVPTGVFATYYGVSLGLGIGAPINYDLTVTNYTLLVRNRYGIPPGGELYLNDLEKYQKSTVNRTIAAVLMTYEITLLGGGPLNYYIGDAIGQLWSFVHRP